MSNSKSHPNAYDQETVQLEAAQPDNAQAENTGSQGSFGSSSSREGRHQQHRMAAEGESVERVVTVEIPPHTEFVRVARLAATGVASRMRFTYDQIEDIKLAISEACNNAILHARPVPGTEDSATSSIIVRFWPYDDRLEISVADGGHLPPPGLPLHSFSMQEEADDESVAPDDLPESGMGLMLIQALMDEVSQPEPESSEVPSTTLRMTKRLRPL